MYQHELHQEVKQFMLAGKKTIAAGDIDFYTRLQTNVSAINELFYTLYGSSPSYNFMFAQLLQAVIDAYKQRPASLKQRDKEKFGTEPWYISNELCGMSLYVDRFAGNLQNMVGKLDYLESLGVNVLHLMPLFKSPANESDGGYAVSDFRKVDERFGTNDDLNDLVKTMHKNGMQLMLDIVLNHTSDQHAWAVKAKAGEKEFQDYYYFYKNRELPDRFETTMPDIFPESAPGSFTWIPETSQWVMTVFHKYQWDLNYTNPRVFISMLENIFYYANLGVDILRIDAPAFIWKQLGTACQNLHEAHLLLRLIRLCVEVASPGMALLAEAIVSPEEIMKYFGTPPFTARECQFAYQATHMALQWDALATGDTRVMLAAQHQLLQKPYGTSWITYTRCHDDIGLGYDDNMIRAAGYEPYAHRSFLKEYYSGEHPSSTAKGALFGVNPKTNDARISGSLASLSGLENALHHNDEHEINAALNKIILMQAHSLFLGGLPMLFYGDERATINNYNYLNDEGKAYDNRWMHRPVIDWKDESYKNETTTAGKIFYATRKLITLRKRLDAFADRSNMEWFTPHNIHVAGYVRHTEEQRIFCVFNFSNREAFLTWYAFREKGLKNSTLIDHYSGNYYYPGSDREYLVIPAYGFMVLEGIVH